MRIGLANPHAQSNDPYVLSVPQPPQGVLTALDINEKIPRRTVRNSALNGPMNRIDYFCVESEVEMQE
jgi:hypothetical protein